MMVSESVGTLKFLRMDALILTTKLHILSSAAYN
jgi:hypothetical protein